MRKRIYIKEEVLKNKLSNFLYGSKIEKELYKILCELGVKEDKYIAKNYNSEDSSFDCEGRDNTYKIRLGREYAPNNSVYETIEINHQGIGINYFYYLNSLLEPSLKVRDYSKEINGKKYTRVINYSPDMDKKESNTFIRSIKQNNEEVFFFIEDPKIDYEELDKKIISKDFNLDWPSVYQLLENYGKIDKYIVYRKKNGKIEELASFGFPLEEVYNHYTSDREEDNVKIRIKRR